jgi:hypothetical protein
MSVITEDEIKLYLYDFDIPDVLCDLIIDRPIFEYQLIDEYAGRDLMKPIFVGHISLCAARDYQIHINEHAIISSGYKARIPFGHQFRMEVIFNDKLRTYIISHKDTLTPDEFVDLDILVYNSVDEHISDFQTTIYIREGSKFMRLYMEAIPIENIKLIDSTSTELKETVRETKQNSTFKNHNTDIQSRILQDCMKSLQFAIKQQYYEIINPAYKMSMAERFRYYYSNNNNTDFQTTARSLRQFIFAQVTSTIDNTNPTDIIIDVFNKQMVIGDFVYASNLSYFKTLPNIDGDGFIYYVVPAYEKMRKCQVDFDESHKDDKLHWHVSADKRITSLLWIDNPLLRALVMKYPVKLNIGFVPNHSEYRYMKHMKALLYAAEQIWNGIIEQDIKIDQ